MYQIRKVFLYIDVISLDQFIVISCPIKSAQNLKMQHMIVIIPEQNLHTFYNNKICLILYSKFVGC